MVQLWKLNLIKCPCLFRRPLLAGAVLHQEIRQLIYACVDKRPVRIAPLAVFLVPCAIRLPADGGIVQGHPAALADELPGRAQKGVDRDVKFSGQQLQRIHIGHSLASGKPPAGSREVFPPAPPEINRFPFGDSKLSLWYPLFHHLMTIIPSPDRKDKQPVVAPALGTPR